MAWPGKRRCFSVCDEGFCNYWSRIDGYQIGILLKGSYYREKRDDFFALVYRSGYSGDYAELRSERYDLKAIGSV